MKSVYLSRHAKRRMRLHDISIEQVTQTLEQPEKVVPSIKGRYNAYRRIGERFLRLTYREEEERFVVVSVTPRKRF
ncbi:MAG: DUF4258 domain-containing protein [Dehalococcoidia bacterium]|nr:DUF4258 domain-containing protein [Dehalococcoidia bacterium]